MKIKIYFVILYSKYPKQDKNNKILQDNYQKILNVSIFNYKFSVEICKLKSYNYIK